MHLSRFPMQVYSNCHILFYFGVVLTTSIILIISVGCVMEQYASPVKCDRKLSECMVQYISEAIFTRFAK